MRRITLLVLTCLLFQACAAQPGSRFTVITHPDGPLYVGDHVSFEVLPPASGANRASDASVTFQGKEIGQADFAPYGLGERDQATFWWAWDTHDLKPGTYDLTFTILPGRFTQTETFRLHPANQVPLPEPGASWVSTTSTCCIFHYITGTNAARDINSLSQIADEESATVSAQLETRLNSPIDVVIMSRVIGQGGFTGGGVYVTYLDENYMGNGMSILFHHEFVHYYDALRGGDSLPSMFQEGLAVYLSGGHFKPEPLVARAAALLDLDRYIPLTTLANDFYNQDHDTGYLEAAALVEYLVEIYGWEGFNGFYLNMHAPANGTTVSSVIDSSLQDHFHLTLLQLESTFLRFLHSQAASESVLTDLQVTLRYYDTVRRYQHQLDPSAYFLTAWLPNGADMRQQGIVADFLRRPMNWDNQLLETMFIKAHDQYFSGEYTGAEATLRWINLLLDLLPA